MRFGELFFAFLALFSFVYALPSAYPKDTELDLGERWNEILESEGFASDELPELSKRDNNNVESLVKAINRSGIIWDFLDTLVKHPKAVSRLANLTGNLIESSAGKVNISVIEGLLSTTNVTALVEAISESGLLESVLDGVLLDKNYRHVIEDIIERFVYSNIDMISFIFNDIFLKEVSLMKRDDSTSKYSGSFGAFLINTIASVLSSQLLVDSVRELANALNNTGVGVYVVKRFIANESYQNLTIDFAKDIYNTGAINLNLTSLNISAIVGTVLENPKIITNLVSNVLSNNNTQGNEKMSKYVQATKDIVQDLQNDGLFEELNNNLFPSSSSSASSPSSTSTGSSSKKKTVDQSKDSSSKSNSETKASSRSSSNAASSLDKHLKKLNYRILIFLHFVVFGGTTLLF